MDAARLCCLKTERAAIMFATSATRAKAGNFKGKSFVAKKYATQKYLLTRTPCTRDTR